MKLYIIYKVGISGWNKDIEAIFKNKEDALKFKKELQSNNQYYYEIIQKNTKD